ncbi:HDL487Wp [Eremothecium sinecaudum]|uniref:HDL487Wp n=1 Tax=Eremothecium sinecaudum TaxID=45286 RepID=A0A0X8HRQ4_9SACH|nr:HDL487Wp [Eremothecium sinecaudum]AMD20257.1 HDL487Wp [Eremothecium sinecaudum]
MDPDSIDDLFDQLRSTASNDKAASTPGSPQEAPQPAFDDSDEISLRDSTDDKVARQQQQFRTIEHKLRTLPKLQSDFDTLPSSSTRSPVPIPPATQPAPSSSSKWFELPKPVHTTELKRDLALIRHRAALDPKRHYKKEKWHIPDRFSVGTIVEGPTEFYSSRLSKKQRKSTILESLMVDEDTTKYFRRKYAEVQQTKQSSRHGRKGHYKALRSNRRA